MGVYDKVNNENANVNTTNELTDKDSDCIGALNSLPQVIPLHLLNGVIAGVLLHHEPLQDALLPLEVASVDDSLFSKSSEKHDGGEGEHSDSLGKVLVLQLDNGDASSFCIIVNILQLLQDSITLFAVCVRI